MNNLFKKSIASLCIFSILFSITTLTGCSKDEENNNTKEQVNTDNPESPKEDKEDNSEKTDESKEDKEDNSEKTDGPKYSEDGSQILTIQEFIKATPDEYTWYELTGKVSEIDIWHNPDRVNPNGNFTLSDKTGKIKILGLTITKTGRNNQTFESLNIQEGDVIKIHTLRHYLHKGDKFIPIGGGIKINPAYFIEKTKGEKSNIIFKDGFDDLNGQNCLGGNDGKWRELSGKEPYALDIRGNWSDLNNCFKGYKCIRFGNKRGTATTRHLGITSEKAELSFLIGASDTKYFPKAIRLRVNNGGTINGESCILVEFGKGNWTSKKYIITGGNVNTTISFEGGKSKTEFKGCDKMNKFYLDEVVVKNI